MNKPSYSKSKIYDPETGKLLKLENLIVKLGVEAVAHKYKVSESTVYKWRRQIHKPARKTLSRSSKRFL